MVEFIISCNIAHSKVNVNRFMLFFTPIFIIKKILDTINQPGVQVSLFRQLKHYLSEKRLSNIIEKIKGY